jgi:hypothetical protein
MGSIDHAAEFVLEHTEGPSAVIGLVVGAALAWPQQGIVYAKGPSGDYGFVTIYHNAFTHSIDLGKVIAAGIPGGLVVAAVVAGIVWCVIYMVKSLKPKPPVTQPPPRD